MKKSVIKRRKRVIPASHEAAPEGSATAESVESSASPPDMSSERGSMNPDGSINLGLRRRQEQQTLQLVPESVLRQNRPSPPLPSGDLTQYSSNARHHREIPASLTDDNRLAPITSIARPVGPGRQSSLSPASFLSPTRKRSFGESDYPNSAEPENNNKRLSSIKSILYPATASKPQPSGVQVSPRMMGAEDLARQRGYIGSPATTMASAPSPGAYSTASPTPSHAAPAQGYVDARRLSNESEVSKAERRAALQREADRMREMLAAKERELAELGN